MWCKLDDLIGQLALICPWFCILSIHPNHPCDGFFKAKNTIVNRVNYVEVDKSSLIMQFLGVEQPNLSTIDRDWK